jgi:hypothetical protein
MEGRKKHYGSDPSPFLVNLTWANRGGSPQNR